MILKINKLDCTIYLYKYYMVYTSVSYGHKMLTNNYIEDILPKGVGCL